MQDFQDEDAIRRVLSDPGNVDRAAGLLKALGHPARIRIVATLCCRGELAVGDLVEALGLPQAALSQQLTVLRLNGVVTARKAGGFRFYSLALPHAAQMLRCIATCPMVAGS